MGVVPSIGITAHKKVCPLELVQCDYHDIGCKTALITRKELKEHYKGKMPEHINLIKSSVVESINRTEEKLEQHLKNTDKFMENTKRNFDKLKADMKTVEDHITKINARAIHTNLDTGTYVTIEVCMLQHRGTSLRMHADIMHYIVNVNEVMHHM